MDRIAERVGRRATRTAGRTTDHHGWPRRPHARHRAPRRRDARQRGELPHQEALHRRPGHRRDREPGPHMTQLAPCPVWAPRSGAAAPRPSSRTCANADCILIMGSNMAESHPVGVPLRDEGEGARRQGHPRRPALHPHVGDGRHPRRRSAPARDIVFLGGLISYVLENETLLQGVRRRTTPTPRRSSTEDFKDTEDLDGLFSRLRPGDAALRPDDLAVRRRRGRRRQPATRRARDAGRSASTAGAGHARPAPPQRDPTLQDPRCVFQILKRHYARYTPEMVEQICGIPRETFLRGRRDARRRTPGRERTTAFCYAVGWTQHTTGVQMIRAARSSSSCSATSAGPAAASWRCAATPRSRARPTSRRSTTSCPATCRCRARARSTRRSTTTSTAGRRRRGWWSNFAEVHRQPAQGLVRRRGDAGERLRLRLRCRRSPATTRTSRRCCAMMRRRASRACSAWARTRPSAARTPGSCARALAKLDWLVVRDLVRDRDRRRSGSDAPEVQSRRAAPGGHRDRGLPHAGRRARREGRLVHQHPAARAVARQGARPARRRALASSGSCTTWPSGSRRSTRTRRDRATGRSAT